MLDTIKGPVYGYPRHVELVTIADLPHLKHHENQEHLIWVDKAGTINWNGDRPDEEYLKSGDQLRWVDSDNTNESSDLTRAAAGTPPAITIASGQRVSGSYATVLDYPGSERVHVGTDGKLIWTDGYRPEAKYRVANMHLYRNDGTSQGLITWNDSGDTVATGAPNASPNTYAFSIPGGAGFQGDARPSGRIDFSNDDGSTIAGTITDRLIVGDHIRIGTDNPLFTVSAIDKNNDRVTVSNAPESRTEYLGTELLVYRKGVSLTRWSLRVEGFVATNWSVWVTGNYYGPSGIPERPNPFLLQVNAGGGSGKKVELEFEGGATHTWSDAADNAVFKVVGEPCLVRAVLHGTSITKFYAASLVSLD